MKVNSTCAAALVAGALSLLAAPLLTSAQDASTPEASADVVSETATTSTILQTLNPIPLVIDPKPDLTRPDDVIEREATLALLSERRIDTFSIFTIIPWWVQDSILSGVPANTVVLILLLPILTTIVAFSRVVIGLPGLEILVPIALAYALVALGVVLGGVILGSIVLSAFLSRMLLKHVRIMYYPKRSLSMLVVALLVLISLTVTIKLGFGQVSELSIFPILILALLADALVSVQLHKSMSDAVNITLVTIGTGVLGYVLATATIVRDTLVLYPEVILLLIPINLMMGRYFGLRISEMFRFRSFNVYGSQ